MDTRYEVRAIKRFKSKFSFFLFIYIYVCTYTRIIARAANSRRHGFGCQAPSRDADLRLSDEGCPQVSIILRNSYKICDGEEKTISRWPRH